LRGFCWFLQTYFFPRLQVMFGAIVEEVRKAPIYFHYEAHSGQGFHHAELMEPKRKVAEVPFNRRGVCGQVVENHDSSVFQRECPRAAKVLVISD